MRLRDLLPTAPAFTPEQYDFRNEVEHATFTFRFDYDDTVRFRDVTTWLCNHGFVLERVLTLGLTSRLTMLCTYKFRPLQPAFGSDAHQFLFANVDGKLVISDLGYGLDMTPPYGYNVEQMRFVAHVKSDIGWTEGLDDLVTLDTEVRAIDRNGKITLSEWDLAKTKAMLDDGWRLVLDLPEYVTITPPNQILNL